jgi:hypothetical protein
MMAPALAIATIQGIPPSLSSVAIGLFPDPAASATEVGADAAI